MISLSGSLSQRRNDTSFWDFSLRSIPYAGFWSMAHEARTDWAMLLGSIFLLIVGGGALVCGRVPGVEKDK